MTIPGNITGAGLSLLFLASAAAAALLHLPALLAVPVAFMAVLWMIRDPALLVYVLVASVPWSIEYNFTASLASDLPDEPLMLLASFVIICILAYQRRSLPVSLRHPLVFLLIAQFAWVIISVVNSTDFILSFKYMLAKTWYLLAFVALPVYLFRDRISIRNVAISLLVSMMLFMFVALVRHAGNGWTFEKINDSVEPFFRNHVNYSALLVFMVPLQLAILRYTSSRLLKDVLRVLLVITLAALYFSYARGAWLALLTGLAGYWLLRKKLLLAAVCVGFFLTIASVFLLKHNDHYLKYAHDFKTTIFHTDFRSHLVATYQLRDVSTAERFYRWIAGVRMIRH
ncbi:MAG TPA: O-antigen ligase family protein, partial [Flavisolibacter sp.]